MDTLQEQEIYWKEIRGKHIYLAKSKIGGKVFTAMHEHLGNVKEKNDGRFEYTLRVCPYRTDWPVKQIKQGVVATLEEAKQIVESGWSLNKETINV